jgi:hypothetical protein
VSHLPLPLALVTSLALSGCARLAGAACDCPDGRHGAVFDGACACHPGSGLPPWVPPEDARRLFLDPDAPPDGDGSAEAPWTALDWPALDAALAAGPVVVHLPAARLDAAGEPSPVVLPEVVRILRADPGPHRLVLDGRSLARTAVGDWVPHAGARAVVPGVRTPFEGGPYSHITLVGLEITGSRDKGVSWWSGDAVELVDLAIHDNGGSPAVYLDYSNRSGHAGAGFVLRDSHVWNQPGECVYIGGSEGEEAPSHTGVVVVGNLIHDCRDPFGTRNDGINIKDRLGPVEVRENVVYRADWGIEAGSPGRYAHNVVLETEREGILVNDSFGPVDGLIFEDNVVVGAGHDGVHIAPLQPDGGRVEVRRTTVVGARRAGLLVGGEHPIGVLVEDVVAVGNRVGLDGWGAGSATVEGCAVADNGTATDRNLAEADCAPAPPVDMTRPAGPDGWWLTADDPGWVAGGARR